MHRLRGVLQLACQVWIWMCYNGLMWLDALGLYWSSQPSLRDGHRIRAMLVMQPRCSMRPGRRMALSIGSASNGCFFRRNKAVRQVVPSHHIVYAVCCNLHATSHTPQAVVVGVACDDATTLADSLPQDATASFTRRVATRMPCMDMDAL